MKKLSTVSTLTGSEICEDYFTNIIIQQMLYVTILSSIKRSNSRHSIGEVEIVFAFVKGFHLRIHIHMICTQSCLYRGQILGRYWDKNLESFPPCHSQSPLLTYYSPLPPLSKRGLTLVCNINIVYGNVKSENSQDYAQKP